MEVAGIVSDLTGLSVESLDDGGMGSMRFEIGGNRVFFRCAADCMFQDSDGVVVFAALNLDQEGQLYELDIWKTDFSPLLCWPRRGEIQHAA
jgi:hypothetical protein